MTAHKCVRYADETTVTATITIKVGQHSPSTAALPDAVDDSEFEADDRLDDRRQGAGVVPSSITSLLIGELCELFHQLGSDRQLGGRDTSVGDDRSQVVTSRGRAGSVPGIGHSHTPSFARAVTRYVAAALLVPLRQLQRRAWVRRAAVIPWPSGTTRGSAAK